MNLKFSNNYFKLLNHYYETKLILLCFLALSVITKAQWAAPAAANLTDVRDRVGIRFGGVSSWLPSYAFHVIEQRGSSAAGYLTLLPLKIQVIQLWLVLPVMEIAMLLPL